MEQEGLFEPKKKMTSQDLTVPDGTSLNLAVSALIKELRRGKAFEALYWARQLEQRYYRYLWRRLLIFCSEDVGLASPEVIAQVIALREAYMILKEESRTGRGDPNHVAQAVYVLARSPKNKEIGFAWMTQQVMEEMGWRAEVPDYAIDRHTAEGKKLRPDPIEKSRHWFSEAQVVENRVGPMDFELWWARMKMTEGLWTEESVEAWAIELDERGLLEYGVKGPPFLMNPKIDKETGEIVGTQPGAIDMHQVTDLPD